MRISTNRYLSTKMLSTLSILMSVSFVVAPSDRRSGYCSGDEDCRVRIDPNADRLAGRGRMPGRQFGAKVDLADLKLAADHRTEEVRRCRLSASKQFAPPSLVRNAIDALGADAGENGPDWTGIRSGQEKRPSIVRPVGERNGRSPIIVGRANDRASQDVGIADELGGKTCCGSVIEITRGCRTESSRRPSSG